MSKTLMVIGGDFPTVMLAWFCLTWAGYEVDTGYWLPEPDWKDYFTSKVNMVDGIAICWPEGPTLNEQLGFFWELRQIDRLDIAPESVKRVEEWLYIADPEDQVFQATRDPSDAEIEEALSCLRQYPHL